MFVDFFYALRKYGLGVTLAEFLDLQAALDLDLCKSSLMRFYYVARAILVKSETDYDKYDLAFDECFRPGTNDEVITEQMLRWLDKSELLELADAEARSNLNKMEDVEESIDKKEIEEEFRKKAKEQDSEHNGGSYWIGSVGKTSYGASGSNIGGLRVGGKTGHQSAYAVVGERKYRDFRDDRVIDNRDFTLALRKLRQFSARLDIPEDELDIDATVDATCSRGGCLDIVMRRPRKNSVKLMLLMDSGGTMIPYTTLLNDVFQSVNKSNHYKDVKTYFFHNCIYSHLYKTPECEYGDWVETEWVLRNIDRDYKVIIVGDAAMAPEELYSDTGNYRGPNGGLSGWEWLTLIKRGYRKVVWLNPKMATGDAPWREAETAIRGLFPMYKLTTAGLNTAMEELMDKK